MAKITEVLAREILDSRTTPTIEVTMKAGELRATFSTPSGASTGTHEAHELRDGDAARYGGKGVRGCVQAIEALRGELVGRELGDQAGFDVWLIERDGTPNKDKLGGNTILALSGVYLRLSAVARGLEVWQLVNELLNATARGEAAKPAFPRIYANLVNGGKHAPGLDVQEFMVVPRETRPSLAVPAIAAVYSALGAELKAKYGPFAHLVGDEGGYVPAGAKHADIWQMLRAAAPAADFDLACDVAASSLAVDDDVSGDSGYHFEGATLTRVQLADIYRGWAAEHNLLSVEDPFAEADRTGFALVDAASSPAPTFFVVGDDISVTSAERITELAAAGLIGGVIIKPNQIGTVTETIAAVQAAHAHSVKVVVSHRSGETNDDFVADLAYGVGAFGLKIGAPARGERVAKYNRLLAIEESL
jgi:enolase